MYNGIYLGAIQILLNCLGFFSYVHGEVCAKILCSEKELLNLKDSKLTQIFMAIRLVLSDRVTYVTGSANMCIVRTW